MSKGACIRFPGIKLSETYTQKGNDTHYEIIGVDAWHGPRTVKRRNLQAGIEPSPWISSLFCCFR